ncbi:MAG TPA: Coq4 family protein [Sphingomonadaceae bacterium]|nr:Coq4 family protein [Sphingomonadaceae bacterium]
MDPSRPSVRYRPLKAWHHFRELVKNKEDTSEVFRIFEALPWKGMPNAARQFLASERGRAVMAGEPSLVELLDDHAALRRMPKGSVAQAYCDFMEREGLTAQGLVDEFDRFMADRPQFRDQFAFYLDRLRDTHDLLHVLTGYGRDALGEQCVLAFTYSQQPAPAHLLIAYAGAWEAPRIPVFRAVREAQRLGKACPRVAELSVRDWLPVPLDKARAMLKITPPRHYHECHRIWREDGIDPYAVLRPQPA